jgi:acetyl esterase/lipase
MTTSPFRRFVIASFIACSSVVVHAQMSPDVADRIKALGRVVNPPATAAVYAPRLLEKEPYAAIKVQRDIKYGEDERNLLDVFSAESMSGAARPVFIFVHGGAFTRGDRRSPPGAPFYDNIMVWAARNGMIGVNVTYRLAPKATWPAGAQDLGQAVRWVHENIAARGGDPAKVYLMGHSAGAAHVASYVADERFQQVRGSGLAGALMLSGVYQLSPEFVAAEDAVKVYFGTDASKYAERSAQAGLAKSRVPMWIGYAELDPPFFEVQAQGVRTALCDAGHCPAFIRFAGHSHMSEIYSVNTDDRQVSDAMLAFVKAH